APAPALAPAFIIFATPAVPVAAEAEPVQPAALDAADVFRRQVAGHEGIAAGALAILFGGGELFGRHPAPFQALGTDFQRLAGQLGKQRRPHPHRAGGAVEAGRLVAVVADPDHRQVLAGEAGEPAVAAVVAGTGLAGGTQVAEAVGDQAPAG